MVARGRNSTSDNHCAIDRSICVRWPWCESISCEEKYPRHIQANWFALFVKTTLSLRYGRGRCDSPHQGAGLPDDPCCFLIMRCTPTIHELIVLTLPSTCCTAGCPTSRNFVPWRFLDAGQLSLPSVSSLPTSKNQNNNRHHWSIGHGQFTLRKTILFM